MFWAGAELEEEDTTVSEFIFYFYLDFPHISRVESKNKRELRGQNKPESRFQQNSGLVYIFKILNLLPSWCWYLHCPL